MCPIDWKTSQRPETCEQNYKSTYFPVEKATWTLQLRFRVSSTDWLSRDMGGGGKKENRLIEMR